MSSYIFTIAAVQGITAMLLTCITIYRMSVDVFKSPLVVRVKQRAESNPLAKFGEIIGVGLLWGSVQYLENNTMLPVINLALLLGVGSMAYYYSEVLLPTIWHPMHVSWAWAFLAIYYMIVNAVFMYAIAVRDQSIALAEMFILAEVTVRAGILALNVDNMRNLVLKESQEKREIDKN